MVCNTTHPRAERGRAKRRKNERKGAHDTTHGNAHKTRLKRRTRRDNGTRKNTRTHARTLADNRTTHADAREHQNTRTRSPTTNGRTARTVDTDGRTAHRTPEAKKNQQFAKKWLTSVCNSAILSMTAADGHGRAPPRTLTT